MTRPLTCTILICATSAALSLGVAGAAGAAAPGSLDPGFGNGGIASSGLGTRLFGTAVQGDRKVVAVGDTGTSASLTLLLARFTPGGSLDRSFGAGGLVRGPTISGTADPGSIGRAVAIQPDGKIVVVGKNTSSNGLNRDGLLVERFNSNGSRDTSFGSGGVVNLLTGNSFGDGYAVAVQPDGRIVATGTADAAGSGGTAPRAAVVRLNPNGSLDGSFGFGGIAVIDLGAYSYALAVEVQSDGKIVIAGSQAPGLSAPNALIARLTPSGALDPTFAGTGVYAHQYAVGAANSGFRTLAIEPDGRIVAAGSAASGDSGVETLVVRFTASGTPDGSFGSGGVVYTPSAVNYSFGNAGTVPGANGVALAPNGDIVVGGMYANGGATYATLWALTSRGSLDRTFGQGGAAVLTNSDQINTECDAIAFSPTDGDLVATGDAVPFGGAYTGIAARYVGFGAPVPPLKLSVSGIGRSYKTVTVARRGLQLSADCNVACAIVASLTVTASEGRKLHLKVRGHQPLTIATRRATLTGSGGRRQITLTLGGGDVNALETQKRVPLTLVVTATAALTHAGSTISRGITLSR